MTQKAVATAERPRVRKEPQDRQKQIIDAAYKLALRVGYEAITRDAIAVEAGVSAGLVTRFFSMDTLRIKIRKLAIKNGESDRLLKV
jgi:AcrR family transcriptional regulator